MKKVASLTLVLLCVAVSGILTACTHEEPVPSGEPIPDRAKKIYSQADEELIIRDFFDDRRDGFFVDVGSFHWQDLSTTYFLEKHLGWHGIAIDAQAGFAEGYKKHRPNTKFFGYAVSDKSGETLKLHLAFGASSLDPDWHKKFLKGREDQELKAVDVPTITLNDLLEQNHITKIDFLSIDIEGAEPLALAGFDIEKYKPEFVCIEASKREAVASYFDQHGYERIDDKRDSVNGTSRGSEGGGGGGDVPRGEAGRGVEHLRWFFVKKTRRVVCRSRCCASGKVATEISRDQPGLSLSLQRTATLIR